MRKGDPVPLGKLFTAHSRLDERSSDFFEEAKEPEVDDDG
jgi:hypothetical protein